MNARGRSLRLVCEEGAARLDAFLADRLSELSRSRLKTLIRDGCVRVGGEVQLKAAHAVSPGAMIEVSLPPPEPSHLTPEEIPLDVRYEDEHLLVVNKPPGMVVHPGAGQRGGTLAAALLHHCRGQLSGIGGVERPGIVHRLDKDTSGLIIAAKTDSAHRRLSADLKARRIKRSYLVLVKGVPVREGGTVDAPIGRHPAHRIAMAVVRGGRPAVTHYAIREVLGEASLLEVNLETGRTHQIRVHMSHIGHPVLGDTVYNAGRLPRTGRKKGRAPGPGLIERQALHAHRLVFRHPASGAEHRIEAEPPEDFLRALEKLRRP